jgi:hypothetical protein
VTEGVVTQLVEESGRKGSDELLAEGSFNGSEDMELLEIGGMLAILVLVMAGPVVPGR